MFIYMESRCSRAVDSGEMGKEVIIICCRGFECLTVVVINFATFSDMSWMIFDPDDGGGALL
jgi:hypothetical protein